MIAEAGVNHNGDIGRARALIDAAADAGADAVKFQLFKAERLTASDAPKAAYQVENTGSDETQFEMLKALELSIDAHEELQRYATGRGILFLSTPFDEESADALAGLQLPVLKLPSGEVTNHPFLRHVASLGLPIILSTGMSNLTEVESAVAALRDGGANDIALLHCVSQYPSPEDQTNLRAMATMRDAIGVPVGYSDHTMGIHVPVAAVAMGACVIEKHFTLDRELPGPDHKASLEPGELAAMCQHIREVQSALGNGEKVPAPTEAENRRTVRKSLALRKDLPAGSVLTRDDLWALRPGTGITPDRLDEVIGRTLRVAVAASTILTEDALL